MALTEEQKRRLQEKAAAEIASVRQKQEEQEYYEQLLAEQGIVRTVHTPQDRQNEQVKLILKILVMAFAFLTGVSLVLPYAKAMGISVGFANNVTGNDWFCLLVLCIVAFICAFCDSYTKSAGAGILSIIGLMIMNYRFRESMPTTEVSILVQNGIGWYLFLIGAIGITIVSIVLNKLIPPSDDAAQIKRQRFGTETFGVGMISIVAYIVFSISRGV